MDCVQRLLMGKNGPGLKDRKTNKYQEKSNEHRSVGPCGLCSYVIFWHNLLALHNFAFLMKICIKQNFCIILLSVVVYYDK